MRMSDSDITPFVQVTPVRSSFSKRSGGGGAFTAMAPIGDLPRNSTAPNFFVDPTLAIPRNSSTPGFGHLAVLHGHATVGGGGQGSQTIYGIQVGTHTRRRPVVISS